MNIILPFILNDGLLRGRFVKLDSLMSDALCHQHHPKMIEQILAESVTVALMLSSFLKYEGLFTMQIQGKGPVTLLVVDITSEGKVRTSIRYDEALLPKDNKKLQDIFGTGVLVFTVDQATQKDERYQGVVELSGSSLAEAVEKYFQSSEQILTHLLLFSREKNGLCQTGGLVVQLMPDNTSSNEKRLDAFETACVLADSLKKVEFFDEKLSAEKLLFRLYHADHLLLFPAKQVSFACRCSEEKVKKMLRGFSTQELDAMYQNGEIQVDCQFCGKTYCFKKGEWE